MPETIVADLDALLASDALDARRRTHFRLVRPDDAEFILELRTNPSLGKYLSVVANDVNAQRRWIELYKERERRGEEFYFLIIHDGCRIGTVRMYEFLSTQGLRSFSWGSWIISMPRPKGAAIVSMCLTYRLGFSKLKFNRSSFEVALKNRRVIDFHLWTGAERLAEAGDDAHFLFRPAELETLWERHKQALIAHEQYQQR